MKNAAARLTPPQIDSCAVSESSTEKGAHMEIYKRIASFRTPFLYPRGWAFVLGAALGVGYAIGVAIELRRCAGA